MCVDPFPFTDCECEKSSSTKSRVIAEEDGPQLMRKIERNSWQFEHIRTCLLSRSTSRSALLSHNILRSSD
ncbi:hypothetical protein MPTK2_8g11700 [Marchantia polymorpha subsp. ruderalis]